VRIVHTEASLGWGGQEIRILSEAKGLIGRGHEVVLLCPAEARIYREAPAWKVPAVALPIGAKRPRGVSALVRWFMGNRCDVVSTHSSTDSWLTAFALLWLRRRFPMVRTRHISAPVPRNAASRWLYTSATTRIVTTGELLKQELVERNGYPAGRIESVPTGVDPRRFRPGDRDAARAALGLPQDKTLIGIVATLRSWKGHLFLIEAVAGLPESVGLVIVGDGPMRERLEALAEKLGLRSRVRFAGNQADVVPWLQSLDVFALPSYANEGVPQALLQAMFAGIACVTTDAGAIPEIARDCDTARVVSREDPRALAAAIDAVLDDREGSLAMAHRARDYVVPRFGLDLMLDRMEQVFRTALADAAQR